MVNLGPPLVFVIFIKDDNGLKVFAFTSPFTAFTKSVELLENSEPCKSPSKVPENTPVAGLKARALSSDNRVALTDNAVMSPLISILPLPIMLYSLRSKSPPSCGVVSLIMPLEDTSTPPCVIRVWVLS